MPGARPDCTSADEKWLGIAPAAGHEAVTSYGRLARAATRAVGGAGPCPGQTRVRAGPGGDPYGRGPDPDSPHPDPRRPPAGGDPAAPPRSPSSRAGWGQDGAVHFEGAA